MQTKKIIDLRSDTVTLPSPEMREAIAKARVGDDVFGEDPTVNELQAKSAEITGKESALFVSSGTMGNLIAALVFCQRGDEVIMGDKAHTFLFEVGGVSALGGIFPHTLSNQSDGTIGLDDIEAAIRPDDIHDPISRLLILENTHNRCGGTIIDVDYLDAAGRLVHERGLKYHLDGARIFNASIASGVSVARISQSADSVTFCLSKGLSAPVGSVLCGSRDFIQHAKRVRKQLGGGMRQVGILAAAGLVGLESMIPRLAEDHQNAKLLAEGLSALKPITLTKGNPQTNMVFISISPLNGKTPTQILRDLSGEGILFGQVGKNEFRLVTHYGISREDIELVLQKFSLALQL